MTRLLAGVTAAALVLTIVGAAVFAMLLPAYTRTLVLRVDAPVLTGLPAEETLELAEEVRAHVAGDPDATLSARLDDGREAFDTRAVVHLDDVRDVIAAARLATLASALVAVAGLALLVREGGATAAARPLKVAGRILLGVVPLAAVAALLDFGRFFAGFHALFFEPGTWQFASDALLIRLFPERFWAISGVAWGALVLLGGALLEVAQRVLEARGRQPMHDNSV